MEQKRPLETTSFTLHLLGMVFMLCDHLWGAILPGNDWLTCLGRLCFPIYAFLLVEGYFHTSNLKKYAKRLFFFALLSEIPFNLMMSGQAFYPVHQNVLWSFLLGMGLITLNENAKKKGKLWLRILTGGGTLLLAYIMGIVTMVDYYHAGVLTVLAFYFFRGRRWWNYLGQLFCLYYINLELLGGFMYEIELFGSTFWLARQGLALLALIPIWLYRGKQGHHSKGWQYFCYAFYPLHALILGLIQILY